MYTATRTIKITCKSQEDLDRQLNASLADGNHEFGDVQIALKTTQRTCGKTKKENEKRFTNEGTRSDGTL